MAQRIFLSSPHMSDAGYELEYVHDAFEKNWIAPLGENVNEFEKAMQAYIGAPYTVALSSGTAALHLSMILAGVKKDDLVFCQDLTFSARIVSDTGVVFHAANSQTKPEGDVTVDEDNKLVGDTTLESAHGTAFVPTGTKLAEGVTAADFGAAMKDAVLNNQWMCGFPDSLLIRALGDSYVVMAFGVNDAMTPFESHLTSVYPGMETIASETIG